MSPLLIARQAAFDAFTLPESESAVTHQGGGNRGGKKEGLRDIRHDAGEKGAFDAIMRNIYNDYTILTIQSMVSALLSSSGIIRR
jgi:hypothetical protein